MDQQFFNDLRRVDYGAYWNFPYTYPKFTMVGLFQRLFGVRLKYYRQWQRGDYTLDIPSEIEDEI